MGVNQFTCEVPVRRRVTGLAIVFGVLACAASLPLKAPHIIAVNGHIIKGVAGAPAATNVLACDVLLVAGGGGGAGRYSGAGGGAGGYV